MKIYDRLVGLFGLENIIPTEWKGFVPRMEMTPLYGAGNELRWNVFGLL